MFIVIVYMDIVIYMHALIYWGMNIYERFNFVDKKPSKRYVMYYECVLKKKPR